jgi:hypothetical protein
MRKLTIEFIRSEFEKEDWTLVSTVYINSWTKLDYVCLKGHSGSIRWGNWQQGQRCMVCAGLKKHTIEYIKNAFKKVGWVCISTKYVNARSKLNYICSEGHYGSTTWDSWQKGHGCLECTGNKKLTINFIKSEFKKEGWVCVSEEYVNNKTNINYICPNGHHGTITWSNWGKGYRCLMCAIIKQSGSGHPNWKGGISCEPYCQDWTKEFKDFIKQRDGYKCLNPYCDSKNPNDLTIHHINYNKKLCGPKNLITVCRSCNARANFDREWHEAWYKALMHIKYGYTYE